MARTETRSKSRRTLIQVILWCIGALLMFIAVIYGIFWLPYREPQEDVPRIMAILPKSPSGGTSTRPLDEFRWVDQNTGTVAIPIELAMDLVRERLPIRADAGEAMRQIEKDNVHTGAGSGRRVSRP